MNPPGGIEKPELPQSGRDDWWGLITHVTAIDALIAGQNANGASLTLINAGISVFQSVKTGNFFDHDWP